MKALILSGLLTLLMAATALSAPKTPRLEPIERISGPEVRETINQPKLYIFDGIKGRHLTLSLWAGSLTAELYSPTGQRLGMLEKEVSQWVGQLPESGLYRIRVTPKREKTSFVLEREFKAQWTYNQARSIPMFWGTKNATVELKMAGYQVQPLTIRARAGQTMTVRATSGDVAIEAPSGELLDQGAGEALAKLPESGLYRVLVVASKPIQALVKVGLR